MGVLNKFHLLSHRALTDNFLFQNTPMTLDTTAAETQVMIVTMMRIVLPRAPELWEDILMMTQRMRREVVVWMMRRIVMTEMTLSQCGLPGSPAPLPRIVRMWCSLMGTGPPWDQWSWPQLAPVAWSPPCCHSCVLLSSWHGHCSILLMSTSYSSSLCSSQAVITLCQISDSLEMLSAKLISLNSSQPSAFIQIQKRTLKPPIHCRATIRLIRWEQIQNSIQNIPKKTERVILWYKSVGWSSLFKWEAFSIYNLMYLCWNYVVNIIELKNKV